MTPNDAQMDVLLRRHAKHAKSDTATTHLDADELNAFAEGSLPPAARSRYVSHLSQCDDCRQIVTQLSISAGAVANAEQSSPAGTEGRSFWQTLAALFALPVLRYAAFAAVLLVVAGVAFFTLRRPRESTMVAQNEPANQAPVSAVKPSGEATPAPGTLESKQTNTERSAAPAETARNSNDETTRDQSIAADKPSPPPKSEAETSTASSQPMAPKKAAELPVTNPSSPTYAPPPPGEVGRVESKSREQQNVGGLASVSGPRKSAPSDEKLKTRDQAQTGESNKDDRAADVSRAGAVNQAPIAGRKGGDEKSGGPKRSQNQDNIARNRNENESRVETAKTQGAGTENRASSEDAPTRSAGGRKFRKQGNAWVDQKFKSSMTLKSVSRGSEEFAALDAGLRSIAQQLGGEIIVVWKNKAYLIR